MSYKFYKGIFDGLGAAAGLITAHDREGDLENTFGLDDFTRLDAALYYDREIKRIGAVKV